MLGRRKTPQGSGEWGEHEAARYLKGLGYRILGRQVRPDPRDEIDLVARAGDVLVFVEVKTRKNEDFGRPADAVDRHKRAVLSRGAVRYLKRLRKPAVLFRFDVVEVIGEPGTKPRIRHIENAFSLDRRYTFP